MKPLTSIITHKRKLAGADCPNCKIKRSNRGRRCRYINIDDGRSSLLALAQYLQTKINQLQFTQNEFEMKNEAKPWEARERDVKVFLVVLI